MSLSKKILEISASPTLALNAKAKEMKTSGIEVLNFSVGEPDFETPENVLKAAHRAIDDGYTKYTPANGLPILKEAIVAKFKRENDLDYDTSEIVVGSGAKPLLYATLVALCDPGDEVIFAAPYWVSYLELVKLADAVPVPVLALEEDDFELKAEAVAEKITEKTKVIILNTPSNPTGGIISEDELRKIAELVVKHDLYVIADEIYERLLYEGKHFCIANVNEEMKKRTITINGASKTYAMTGWRIGYLGADTEIAKPISNFLSHVTGNPNAIAQMAFVEALNGPQNAVENMKKEFRKRRDLFVDGLNSIHGISCKKPAGAFYLYPNFSGLFNKNRQDSMAMASYLLDELHIAAVPGKVFGTDEHIRFSYATSVEVIEECLRRLRNISS